MTAGPLNILDFGVVADGVTDNSVNAQIAISQAKMLGLSLYWPKGAYLITKSLDCTFADRGDAGFWMFGDGPLASIIVGDLTEAFPALDLTGNTYGGLRNLGVKCTSPGSLATACVLASKPVLGGSLGDTVTIEDCYLFMPTDGSVPAALCALVAFNTDLFTLRRSFISGLRGAIWGLANPTGVISKFQAFAAPSSSTNALIEDCTFNGSSGYPFEYTGGAGITFINSYMALVGNGLAGACLGISSSNPNTGNNIFGYGMRTENQSVATGVKAIEFSAVSTGGRLDGFLGTDAAGSAIFLHAPLSGYDINATSSAGVFFGGGQLISASSIKTNVPSIGAIAPTSWGISVGGAIRDLLGSCVNATVQDYAGLRTRSMLEVLVPPTSPTAKIRPVGNLLCGTIGSLPYTGGSGEQLIYSEVVPLSVMSQWSGTLSEPSLAYRFRGQIHSSAQPGGRVRVTIQQGATETTVLDTQYFGGATPAGGQGTFSLDVEMLGVGTSSIQVYAELRQQTNGAPNGQVYNWYSNISPGIVSNVIGSIKVYVTNGGNNPYSLAYRRASIE